MDSNNWRPTQGGEPAMDAGDWRSQLQPDSRQRIVNKIMDTLKKHLPVSGQEGLHELRKIAVRFEEKIYTAANSQSDYLRKISMKMLTMETKSQNSMASSLPSSSMVSGNKPPDSASRTTQSQGLNPGQSLSVPLSANQPHSRPQLLSQNIQNNNAPQSSSSLPSALPPVPGLTTSSMPNIVGQNSSMQNISGVSQNPGGNSMGQGVPSNVFSNSQRPIQGRQVVPQQQQQQQQQQQSQTQHQYLYQQQLQQQLLKQKFPQGIPHSLMQSHMQQQQQNAIQPNQLQSSQQPVLQTSSVMQPSVMQPSLSSLTQNQQSPIQQPTQSLFQQPPQPVLRQQQQSQQHAAMHQQPSMSQQTILPPQQQQQLLGQQSNATNIQQNQLIGQQNNVGDMQQQLPQQPRMHGQQNNLANLQSPPSQQQQQQLMAQQNNLSNFQQQQLGPQSNVPGLQQQQMHGAQSGNSNMQSNQHSAHLLQQNKVQMQQQHQQNTSLLSTQGQQAQLQSSQPQLMSQIPAQSTQLQQQVPLQQQQQPPNVMSRELQQRLQVPGQGSGSLLQSQNVIDQQMQLYHSQRALPETSSTSLDSTAQTGQGNGGDWQEEIYQKIKAMKELYFVELIEMYQKIGAKVQHFENLPQQPKSEQLHKLKAFKTILERLLAFLQVSKNNILPGFKDKIGQYEKQIVSFLHSNRPRNPVSSLQPGQLPASHIHPIQQSQAQMTPLQSPENQINPLHSGNMQGSVASVQQNCVNNLQHNSLSSFSGPATQQNMMSSLQPGSSLESGQGNSLSSLPQVSAGSLQQNPANTSQQANNNSLPSQSGVNPLQPNINSIQLNSNMLQHQHLKQQEQQQLLQSQQQTTATAANASTIEAAEDD